MKNEINWNKNPQRKSDPYYTRYSMGSPFGTMDTKTASNGNEWKRGHYVNKKHTVLIYADDQTLSLSIYVEGVGHYKTLRVKSLPSDLSLSRQASKFSKEVENEKR